MLPKWTRCRDCYDGSDAVKAKKDLYLPKLDSHKEELIMGQGPMGKNASKYEQYLTRALFYNTMGRTVDGLTGAIYQKESVVKVPAIIEDHLDDITLSNKTLDVFMQLSTREVMITGRCGVLVDMTDNPKVDANRPYWIRYRAEDIVSHRNERINGEEKLTRVVLREEVEKPDLKDPFVEECVEQYRVLELIDELYTVTVWQKKKDTGGVKDTDWFEVSKTSPMRRGQSLNYIPFIFIGTVSASAEVETPPLLDLVDILLSHYRGMADLKHGLHFAALPTIVITGAFVGDDGSTPIRAGSEIAWQLTAGSSAMILEVSGPGFNAIQTDLTNMEHKMATLGAKLLEQQPNAPETATAVVTRHSGEHATLRTIVQSVEEGFKTALRWHTWWMGTEADPKDVEVELELNKDFFTVRMPANDLSAWVAALQAGAVSFKTFYEALTRGELTRHGVDAEEEQAEIEEDQAGEEVPPQLDENGNPIQPELDENGNPIQPELDENGDPIEPELDENGDPIEPELDKDGKPIKKPELDKDGKPIKPELDKDGKPIKKPIKPIPPGFKKKPIPPGFKKK